MRKRFGTHGMFVAIAIFAGTVMSLSVNSATKPSGDDKLKITYSDKQIVSTPDSSVQLQMNLTGFEQTFDGRPDDRRLMTAGNPDRHMVLTVDCDTLYSDIKQTPADYEDLWWYFYSEKNKSDLGQRVGWEDGTRYWSTHTVQLSHGVEINERHYDMFQIVGDHWFHVSIKRPFYLEGDSTLMMNVLSSTKVLRPDSLGD